MKTELNLHSIARRLMFSIAIAVRQLFTMFGYSPQSS